MKDIYYYLINFIPIIIQYLTGIIFLIFNPNFTSIIFIFLYLFSTFIFGNGFHLLFKKLFSLLFPSNEIKKTTKQPGWNGFLNNNNSNNEIKWYHLLLLLPNEFSHKCNITSKLNPSNHIKLSQREYINDSYFYFKDNSFSMPSYSSLFITMISIFWSLQLYSKYFQKHNILYFTIISIIWLITFTTYYLKIFTFCNNSLQIFVGALLGFIIGIGIFFLLKYLLSLIDEEKYKEYYQNKLNTLKTYVIFCSILFGIIFYCCSLMYMYPPMSFYLTQKKLQEKNNIAEQIKTEKRAKKIVKEKKIHEKKIEKQKKDLSKQMGTVKTVKKFEF